MIFETKILEFRNSGISVIYSLFVPGSKFWNFKILEFWNFESLERAY